MPEFQFVTGFSRLITVVGYHHVLMIFIGVAIILLSLLLAGCSSSSPQIPTIFLISLFYEKYPAVEDSAIAYPQVSGAIANIVGGAELEVRVGYFGICIQPNGGSFICNQNASALAGIVDGNEDPLNLIWVASTFKDAVVFPYLMIIAVIFAFLCFVLLATFPGWTEQMEEDEHVVKPLPTRAVSQAALVLTFIASVFVLVSVLWQHTASVAASAITQDLGNGSVRSGVGTSAMVLGWFGFSLLVIVTIGILFMILNASLFEKMAEE